MGSFVETGSRTPHVLIIGAGLGGLMLAQCLRKKGVSFEIFERDESESSRGPGFALGLKDFSDLQQFLPDDVPPLESSFHLLPLPLSSQFMFYLPDNRTFGVEDSPSTPCMRVNRLKLRRILSTNVNINWGKKFTHLEDDDEKATAFFDDGTSASGDILIGVDGTFSAVREHVLQKKNSTILEPYPEAVLIGQATVSGDLLKQQLQMGHSGFIAFSRGFRALTALSHMWPDGKSGEYFWVLYQGDDAVRDPDHWMRTASRERLYQHCLDTVSVLDPKFRDVIQLGGLEGFKGMRIFYTAQLPVPPSTKRVVLMGDAAHPIPPFRGEGGLIAIRDATELGDILAQIDTSAANTAALHSRMAKFQRDCIARGSEHVALAQTAMAKAAAGDAPMCWGYKTRPMTVEPLDISL